MIVLRERSDFNYSVMKSENAVLIKNLYKSFGSKGKTVKALTDINLEIKTGEVFGLLGPNGAGKTTLISILTGLVSKDEGTCVVDGIDVDNYTQLHSRINVMRGFSGASRGMSASTMLEYYMRLYNVFDAGKRDALLKEVGLWDRKDQYVSDYSSGLRQRFFLAKALCNNPNVLFLDEPTVGLDIEAANALRAKILELKKQGKTILLTTHYLHEAEMLCDRIALINHGRIIALGTTAQLKKLVKEREVVRISCAKPKDAANKIDGLKGVQKVLVTKDHVDVTVSDRAAARRVFEIAAQSEFEPQAVTIVEPDLEEVFTKLVLEKKNKGGY